MVIQVLSKHKEFDKLPEVQQMVNQHLQGVFQKLPVAILFLDQYGTIIEYNLAAMRMLGEPLQQQKWRNVVQREVLSKQEAAQSINLRNGCIVTIATQPLEDLSGQLILVTDITENYCLQQRLNHYQRLSAMGKMAATLAHQIRTPLATALLYAKTLGDENIYKKPKANNYLQYVDHLVERLHHIEGQIKDMLLFAKGEHILFETLEVNEVIIGIQKACKTIMQQTNSNLQVLAAKCKKKIMGNKGFLIGAVQNCIHNAIDAVEKNAEITLELSLVEGSRLEIIVKDDGPGIDPKIHKKITEAFFTTRSDGTGLGLAVAKMVAEVHSGTLWIKSKLGTGTMVGFNLPCL